MQAHPNTVDPSEIAKFEAMAAEWWDPHGKFKPLHMLNPCRLDYITQQIAGEFDRDLKAPKPFEGLRLLDIGCGGGLLSEPMARLGAEVVGCRCRRGQPARCAHPRRTIGAEIDYRHTTAEAMAAAGEQFDVILNMEVVEHVADPLQFPDRSAAPAETRRACRSVQPSTATRNPMRWPFSGPRSSCAGCRAARTSGTSSSPRMSCSTCYANAGLDPVDRKGFVFNPILWSWSISDRDLSVNYVTASVKPG